MPPATGALLVGFNKTHPRSPIASRRSDQRLEKGNGVLLSERRIILIPLFVFLGFSCGGFILPSLTPPIRSFQ